MKHRIKAAVRKLAEAVGWFVFVTPGVVLTSLLLPAMEWLIRCKSKFSGSRKKEHP